MKKFKDFIKDVIYDKNDLVIALVILALAGFVIHDRIGVIMSYPEILAAQKQDSIPASTEPESETHGEPLDSTEEPDGDPASDPAQNPDAGQNPSTDTGQSGSGTVTPPAKPEQTSTDLVSIYIDYGSTGSQIAQLLIDSGLIKSKEVFYDAVNAAGADTKLQAGSFKIPANATPAQIISIITN